MTCRPLLRGRPRSVTAQASELRKCEIGITPFDCPRDNFLEVWTSRSSPRRPLVRTAPTRREPLGAHHHHLPDRPAPSRPLPGATRPGAVGASAADAFAREAHRSAMLPADRCMARRPDVRVRRPGAGAEGAHGATVMARIAVRIRSFKSNPIENSTPRWQVVDQPVAGACRVERTSTAPPSDGQRERRSY